MDIIVGSKGSGKTARLIELAAKNGGHIVVRNGSAVDHVLRLAASMGLRIQQPVTYWALLEYHGAKDFLCLIDDAGAFIRYVVLRSDSRAEISGMSIGIDDSDDFRVLLSRRINEK